MRSPVFCCLSLLGSIVLVTIAPCALFSHSLVFAGSKSSAVCLQLLLSSWSFLLRCLNAAFAMFLLDIERTACMRPHISRVLCWTVARHLWTYSTDMTNSLAVWSIFYFEDSFFEALASFSGEHVFGGKEISCCFARFFRWI